MAYEKWLYDILWCWTLPRRRGDSIAVVVVVLCPLQDHPNEAFQQQLDLTWEMDKQQLFPTQYHKARSEHFKGIYGDLTGESVRVMHSREWYNIYIYIYIYIYVCVCVCGQVWCVMEPKNIYYTEVRNDYFVCLTQGNNQPTPRQQRKYVHPPVHLVLVLSEWVGVGGRNKVWWCPRMSIPNVVNTFHCMKPARHPSWLTRLHYVVSWLLIIAYI